MSAKPFHERFTEFLVRNWDGVRRVGLLALLVLVILVGAFGYFASRYWNVTQHLPVLTTDDEFDATSPTYWYDRTVEAVARADDLSLSRERELRSLKRELERLIRKAKGIPEIGDRNRALTDIAMAQTASNTDLAIDEIIDSLGGIPSAELLKCRIHGSRALMCLRTGDVSSAQLSIDAYHRIAYDNDVKLESEDARLAFMSVLRALWFLKKKSAVEALFSSAGLANERIPDSALRGAAHRFLAWQEMCCDMKWEALNTSGRITVPEEQSRAFQLIIAESARPSPHDLLDPIIAPLPVTGPWEPVANAEAVKQTVRAVFQQVARLPDAREQIGMLQSLAGSRLMCDQEIEPLFRAVLEESALFEPGIKGPVVALLTDPRSNLIRAARGLPPLPVRPGYVDSADADWRNMDALPQLASEPIDAQTVRSVADQQAIRVSITMSQMLLSFGYRTETRPLLRSAFAAAREQSNPFNRLTNLQSIGSLQITAGDTEGARATLHAASEAFETFFRDEHRGRTTITDANAAGIAMSQIRARFLDDARETIRSISSARQKSEITVLLIRELLRIGEWDTAAALLEQVQPGAARSDFERRCAAHAAGGPPEPLPGGIAAIEKRIREEDFAAALAAVGTLSDPEEADALRLKIVRGYVAIGRPYVGRDDFQQGVRARMIATALETARSQQTPSGRVLALETVVTGFAGGPPTKAVLKVLREAILEAERQVGELPDDYPRTAEILARLARARFQIVVPEDYLANPWPLITEEKNRSSTVEITALLDAALEVTGKAVDRETPQPVRVDTMTEAAILFGQIGCAERAGELAKQSLLLARTLHDRRRMIAQFIRLAELHRNLGDPSEASALLFEASALAGDVSAGAELAPTQWASLSLRMRDGAIDEVVRGQLKMQLFEDALRTIPQISEQVVRDRLYRMLVYRFLYEGRFDFAQTVAEKIDTPALRTDSLKDTEFLRKTR